MPANTYFDAFGILKLDYALFPRDVGGWLQGQRPMNSWEWEPGTAQFNHNVPFQTANGMQLFRDLAYFNDAAGRPLFDPYSFIANGRVLPSNLAADPQVGGVIAYSGHQNGFTHIPLQQALRSTAWFGDLNDQWLATRDRILAENPNATTDALQSLLRDEALTGR